jgi:hypothetical protein
MECNFTSAGWADGQMYASRCYVSQKEHFIWLYPPVALRQRETVKMPRDVRRRIASRNAFEGHGRSWLHRLVDEFVQKLRMGSCNARYIPFGNVLLASPTQSFVQTTHTLHTGTGHGKKGQRKEHNTQHTHITKTQDHRKNPKKQKQERTLANTS